MSIHVDIQNAMVAAAAGALPTGSSLVVYDGTAPANVNTALSGNNVLATFTTAGWGTETAGSITASAITSVTATGTGTATFVRCLVGAVAKYQAQVGGAVTIDNANIVTGGDVNVTGWTLTQPSA
jgi:ABC-type phosphate transport system ATPase subunit